MSVVLGGLAVVLGLAGVVAWSPWLGGVIALGIVVEALGLRSRRTRAKARRQGSQIAALRHIHDIRIAGNEHSTRNAA